MEQNTSINTEQLIMDVAEEMFLDKGFAMTTTTEIARRVGCNQALIHYYFRTKENLFEKLFEKKFLLFTSAISLNANKSLELKERLKEIIIKHLEVIATNPKLPFLIINELTTNPDKFQNIIGQFREKSIELLETLDKELIIERERGNIREISAFDLLLNILSLNIFMFLAKPVLMGVKNYSSQEFDVFILNRKDEIFKTIWGGISISE